MTAQISNFLSSFTTDGARPARFNVQIPIPVKLLAWKNIARVLSFRCENAQLPSVTLETQTRKIYGPTEQQPYLRSYGTSDMTFIVTDSMDEKKFFDAWIQLINPNSSYDTNYKSDYITPITVNQFDVNDQITYSVSLIDAFPINISQLDLDWSNETSIHKLRVTFAYHTWEQNGIQSITSQITDSGVATGVQIITDILSSRAQGSRFSLFPSDLETAGESDKWRMENVASGIDKTRIDVGPLNP
jgi:hypothetical protein